MSKRKKGRMEAHEKKMLAGVEQKLEPLKNLAEQKKIAEKILEKAHEDVSHIEEEITAFHQSGEKNEKKAKQLKTEFVEKMARLKVANELLKKIEAKIQQLIQQN